MPLVYVNIDPRVTAYNSGEGVELAQLNPIMFEQVTCVDGLAWTHSANVPFFTLGTPPGSVIDLLEIDVIPTIPGFARFVQKGSWKFISSVSRSVVTVAGATPSFNSNLNKDVVVDCLKDGINFMTDYLTSNQFRQLAQTAGKSALAVASVTSRIPAAMPIALGALALNLALNFVKNPVSSPGSPASVSVSSGDLNWVVGTSPTVPAETRIQGGSTATNLQDPKRSADYIAQNIAIKDAMAVVIRQKALSYASDLFTEIGDPWDIDGFLNPLDKADLNNQIFDSIRKGALNKYRRLDYGLDKTNDDLISKLSKLDKLDFLSNLTELLCICEGGQSIFGVLEDIKDLFSSGGLDKDSLIEVLDKYFIPSNSSSSSEWNLADTLKQLAISSPSDSEVIHVSY